MNNMDTREIKFRAWVFDEKMVDVEYLKNGKPKWFDIESQDLSDYNDDAILLQYTGLKDKNGVEIYEGDLVECFDYKRSCGVGQIKFGKFDSSHEGGYSRYHYHQGFFIEGSNGEQIRDGMKEDIEWKDVVVIGNIYQNPELLK